MFSLLLATALNAATLQASYAYEDATRQFDAFASEHGSMPMARNPIDAVAAYRAKPEVVRAAEIAKLHAVCAGDPKTMAPGYECTKVEIDPAKLKPVAALLRYSARIILQARYSTLDMHQGMNPMIQNPSTQTPETHSHP